MQHVRLVSGLLVFAVLIAVIGVGCVAFPGDGEVTFGFVSDASDEGTFPAILFLTTRRVVGIVLISTGALLAAGVAGYRMRRGET